jgi:hypothetical protein
MDRRKFLKGAAALSAGLAAAGPLATQGMAAAQKPAGLVPVGCVIAFLKSLSGTSTLPDEFVECNGQALSDSQSIYNGVVIPNLNGASSGTKRFLRGSATGGSTGGTGAHSHTLDVTYNVDGAASAGGGMCTVSWISDTTGSVETFPYYYEVVYVMRTK